MFFAGLVDQSMSNVITNANFYCLLGNIIKIFSGWTRTFFQNLRLDFSRVVENRYRDNSRAIVGSKRGHRSLIHTTGCMSVDRCARRSQARPKKVRALVRKQRRWQSVGSMTADKVGTFQSCSPRYPAWTFACARMLASVNLQSCHL